MSTSTDIKRWLVELTGTKGDLHSRHKVIEALTAQDASRIALNVYSRAISAICKGECPAGKWAASDFIPWNRGQRILRGEKWWAVLT